MSSKQGSRPVSFTLIAVAALALVGCASGPKSEAPASTGAAGGGTSVGADADLQTCPETVGTVRLQDGNAPASTAGTSGEGGSALESLRGLLRDVDAMQQRRAGPAGGVSIESLRLLIQQSNCLAIVERGIGEAAATDEKRRTRAAGNEVRDDANMGPGQEVAADFVLRSMLIGTNKDENSSGIKAGGLLGAALGGVGLSKSESSADVQLVLFDVRSKVQLAVAQGHGSGSNTAMASSVLGRAGRALGGASVGTSSKTSMEKIVLQAYADAFNKMVPAIRNYKAQQVKGGLGAGGTLKVQGSSGDASAVPGK